MITFSLPSLCRIMLAVTALTMTVSCLPGSMPFDSGGQFGAATGDGIGQRAAVPTVARTSSVGFFGLGGGSYYNRNRGSDYGSSYSRCSVCRQNPCRCNNRSSSHYGHDDHDNHRSSSSSMFSSSSSSRQSTASRERNHDHSDHPHGHDTYQVSSSGGLRSGQTKPSGYHSLDWYKSRGYDTSKLNLKNEHGKSKGSSSSKSKSSSSSSSKKKKK